MRLLPLAALAIGVAALPTLAVAESAYTTRIEPRPYYGATVTLEEGVRVFRPLPPHKHIIINPDHRTPVNLSFNETTERNYHYHQGQAALPVYGPPVPVGAYGGFYGGYAGKPYAHKPGGYTHAPKPGGVGFGKGVGKH